MSGIRSVIHEIFLPASTVFSPSSVFCFPSNDGLSARGGWKCLRLAGSTVRQEKDLQMEAVAQSVSVFRWNRGEWRRMV